MDMLKTGDQDKAKKFIENRVTVDFVWEDPLEKYVGKKEFGDLVICNIIVR